MSNLYKWIDEHKAESAGIALVLVGALYLLLRGGSGGASSANTTTAATGASSDYYSAQLQLDQLGAAQQQQQLAAQTQVQQTSIAASVANNQTAAQLAALEDQDAANVQAANIQAGVTNNQTQAQVDVATIQGNVQNVATQAQVQENKDNLASVLGIVSAQDQIQIAQINAAQAEQANNDQTAIDLSGQQYGYQSHLADLNAGIESEGLQDETSLLQQQQQNQLTLSQQIIPLAGQQKNSALDATDQTALFATVLSGGNPGVASTAIQGSTNAAISGNNTGIGAIISSVASSASKAALGLFA